MECPSVDGRLHVPHVQKKLVWVLAIHRLRWIKPFNACEPFRRGRLALASFTDLKPDQLEAGPIWQTRSPSPHAHMPPARIEGQALQGNNRTFRHVSEVRPEVDPFSRTEHDVRDVQRLFQQSAVCAQNLQVFAVAPGQGKILEFDPLRMRNL